VASREWNDPPARMNPYQNIWAGHRSGDPPNMIITASSAERLETYLNCDCYFDQDTVYGKEYPTEFRRCDLHKKDIGLAHAQVIL
jgi:hypothetical protein